MAQIQKQGLLNTIIAYAGMALGYVNLMLLFPLFFTPSQIGLTKVLLAIAQVYAQMAALGVVNITLRYFPFFKDKSQRHHGFLSLSLGMAGLGFVVATGVFFLLKPFIVGKYQAESPELVTYYYWIIPLALFTLAFDVLDAYLRSLFKTVVSSFMRDFLSRVFIAVALCTFILGWVNFHQFVLLFIAANCATTFVLLVYIAWLRQLHPPTLPFNREIKPVRELFQYGLFSLISNISVTIILTIDSLMLASFLGLAEVGVYSTAFFLTSSLMVPARSVYRIAYPMVANYWKEQDFRQMLVLYQKVTLNNLITGGLIFIGIWVSIDTLFSFLPPEFAAGKYVFLLVGLSKLFDITTGLNGVILLTSPSYRSDLIFNLLLVVFVIGANYLLIPPYGLNGAAAASLITLSAYNVLRVWFVWWKFKLQPFTPACLYVTLLGMAVLLVLWWLPHLPNPYLDILVRSALVTTLFMGPVYFFRLSADINSLANKFLRRAGLGRLTR